MTKAKRVPTQGKQKPIGMLEGSRMQYSPKKVGKALHAQRVSLGLSYAELGRQIGVSGETLHNWEEGKAPLAACRIFSWIFKGMEYDEVWEARALRAEAALKDVSIAVVEYRNAHRNGTD